MAKSSRSGAFPPPLGWIPVGIALLVVTAASVATFVPQYASHQVFGVADNGQTGGPGIADTNGQSGTEGKQGKTVLSGGSKGAGVKGNAQPTGGTDDCVHGRNAGATDKGVTATSIHIATTDVTTGIGSGFLGQAVEAMRGAIDQQNRAGGICGRHITLDSINDNWDRVQGATDIGNYISSGNVFALVGEPDSEGLDAASSSGSIDRAGIPVVGTDGMLKSQYNDPWIWPVAASTVTNMHIAADYAYKQLKAHRVGIVFDSVYKFGKEGAAAYAAQVQRSAKSTLGMDISRGCAGGYCGVSPSSTDYSSQIHDFNQYCAGANKCDVVVMLLEPDPMLNWMSGEANCGCTWYSTLMGGEPLFDDVLASNCAASCSNMMVWTGYKPDIQPFDGETPIYTYARALHSVCNNCDPHNEFTEGAYLGTELFIAACQKVGPSLTRGALQQALDSGVFDLGMSTPLRYGTRLPHLANISMTAYRANVSGSFNGWSYLNTGFISDPAPGQDMS